MVFHQLWPNTQKALGPTTSGGFIEVNNCLIWCSTPHKPFGSTFVPPLESCAVVISLRRQLSTASFLEKTILQCSEDNCTVPNLWWKLLFLEKTISQCFSFWEDNLTSAQEDNFTREDNFTISPKGGFKSEVTVEFLLLKKNIFQITILSRKFKPPA